MSIDVNELIERTVEAMGYEFVELERLPRGLMRVTLDTLQDGGITLDDCERVSNQLTHLFTVEGVNYERLEVSSPGIERPLKRAKDWARFVGELAHVELFHPLQAEGFPEMGRRKLEGRIVKVENEEGLDWVTFDFFEVNIAKTPGAALRQRRPKAAAQAPVQVRFTVSDVERAHLLRQLNFKG